MTKGSLHDLGTEQRFQLLVNAVTDYAIYMLDENGRVATWNPGARRFKGYEAEEIIGEHYSRFFTAEDRAAGLPQEILRIAAETGRYEGEGRRVDKNGKEIWVQAVVDAIIGENGQLMGFAKVTRDITDRRRAQEELEEARAALFQSQKLQALGELTGGIAHDFNNLITVIRGSAELLQNEDLPVERRRLYARAIAETADRAATLTSRLLAFGRRQALKPEVIVPGVRLDAFCEVLSRTLGSRIEVVLETEPDLWPIEADATELETALLNAAFNARDAMPDGGRLTISARNIPEEGNVRISVTDTGQGIPPDLLPRVFEPFFTTKPVGKGTGLGLSQIHGFAAQTGGRAEIQSSPAGTTLSLVLPRANRAAAEAPAAVELARADWDRLDVLIVEDNPHVRQFARALLEELRATVTEVATAEEAMARLRRRSFDLVFSDIVMPGMGGLEFARQLKRDMPDQPLLLATGYSNEVSNGEAAGFQIVLKPYGARSLVDAISRALARRGD